MPPRRRSNPSSTPPPNEAARLTNALIGEGFNRRQIAQILGRNSAVISHFYTRGPGAGGSYVDALLAVVQEVQGGGPRDLDSLQRLAGNYVKRRRTKSGRLARVRAKDAVQFAHDEEWTSGIARAGRQHIASGASRLAPILEAAAQADGVVAFTVRASKGRFLLDSGSGEDSPGVHRGVVQRADGTEERSYGNSTLGPGTGTAGFDAGSWHQRVTEHHGDVAAAITDWMVETGRLAEGARITHVELRAWKPED
ncbi:hypothetical protein QMK19_23280 [Streptomyces sp. H10-C2]|uniref:hypothetical protein n=1 Tax=unclassified Streptomyces TaxID=2593676 RepID=UPI0024BB8C79|nr:MULTISPECIES: hypothetical protein [unclassified Streptomyces]MDJ0342830.1 hypothetical protein [Streptomyces sp. PH10-H1]MDJ0372508.1 hypothetical protein [Streptomyces sp. H10-C2]